MNNDFWAPVFAKLLENYEFLEKICNDTSDSDLYSWVKPNPVLWNKAAKYIRKRKITDKKGLVKTIIDYARNNDNLRKIILFNWVEKNKKTMDFTGIRADAQAFDRLLTGEFGSPEKIRILAEIDPRDKMQSFYNEYFEKITQQNNNRKETEDKKTIEKLQNSIERLETKLTTLEKEFDRSLADKRSTEIKLSEIQHEAKSLQIKLTEKNQTEANLKSKISELQNQLNRKDKITTTEQEFSQIHNLQKEKADIEFRLTKLSQHLEQAENDKTELQKTLDRRNSALARIEKQLDQLKNTSDSIESKERQIENLKQLLSDKDKPEHQKIYGQLIQISSDKTNNQWYLLTFAEKLVPLTEKLIARNQVCDGEFCCIELDEQNTARKIFSIESEKRLVNGIFQSNQNQAFLKTTEDSFRIYSKVDNQALAETPIKGILLPNFKDRPEGIYRHFILHTRGVTHEQAIKTVSNKEVCKFYNLHQIEPETIRNILNSQQQVIDSIKDHKLVFNDDYRNVLASMRLQLDFMTVCSKSDCINEAVKQNSLPRQAEDNEACEICNQIKKPHGSDFDFGNKKIIIVGGDYTGQDYCRYLADFNLDVTWQSGFDNRKAFIESLRNYDLVVIVIRQISHTLLREINQFLNKAPEIKVLYAKKRGVSGILKELCEFYNLSN
jgi:hypothetical protein